MISRKQLVVNADDFGFTPDVNEGIVESHRNGILTAATLMANGDAFKDAVRLARSSEFRASLRGINNPYGDGFASEKIVRVLTTVPLTRELLMKRHAQLPVTVEHARGAHQQ